jgi:hypothetical protein
VGSLGVWKAVDGDGDRRMGALGPIEEPIALSWRGVWSEGAKYRPGEVVAYEDSSYVAEADSAGEVPNAKEGPWALMAAKGLQGPAGVFDGTFRSPNGSYSIVVADDGITLQGPPGTIKLRNTGVDLMINNNVSVNAGQGLTLQAGATGLLKATGTLTVESAGQLRLKGSTIQQN